VGRPPLLSGRVGAYTLFTVWCSKSWPPDVITVVMANPDPRIETLERDLAALVETRQTLRANGAGPRELERNRREIVARQHELSETLISIYAPHPAFAI
jgi:hypothetical protein